VVIARQEDIEAPIREGEGGRQGNQAGPYDRNVGN
jgi:hypothetical protein